MRTDRRQNHLRQVKEAELASLAQRILAYDAWRRVHQFADDLFETSQVRYLSLSLDHQEGRNKTSVEWVTAYDKAWRPLPYDFSRPFWKRKLPGDTLTVLEYLDSSIREIIGPSDIGAAEHNGLRQELADELFDGDRSFFKGLPTHVEDDDLMYPDGKCYDLMHPPAPPPVIFVVQPDHRRVKQIAPQSVILVYRGISKPSRPVREQIARNMKAPVKACMRLGGWGYNRRHLVPILERYPHIVFAVSPEDAYISQWRRLSNWLPTRLRKRVRAVFHVKEKPGKRTRQTIEKIDWFLA